MPQMNHFFHYNFKSYNQITTEQRATVDRTLKNLSKEDQLILSTFEKGIFNFIDSENFFIETESNFPRDLHNRIVSAYVKQLSS